MDGEIMPEEVADRLEVLDEQMAMIFELLGLKAPASSLTAAMHPLNAQQVHGRLDELQEQLKSVEQIMGEKGNVRQSDDKAGTFAERMSRRERTEPPNKR